ncbi:hypothetical protein KQY30_01750 [Streptomyces sp. GMY02]|uniref:hypothetical protein n=1 Tax=Streptomyces sp. GMY02 TaxID=1333528 RepID=UPI001C2C31CA|nr:hypothetical protein [Streptomyces sp. GMY02]QXE33211.1 hypothetical protein KQY30_01750 [Streptomyces sp. GMY02]
MTETSYWPAAYSGSTCWTRRRIGTGRSATWFRHDQQRPVVVSADGPGLRVSRKVATPLMIVVGA